MMLLNLWKKGLFYTRDQRRKYLCQNTIPIRSLLPKLLIQISLFPDYWQSIIQIWSSKVNPHIQLLMNLSIRLLQVLCNPVSLQRNFQHAGQDKLQRIKQLSICLQFPVMMVTVYTLMMN